MPLTGEPRVLIAHADPLFALGMKAALEQRGWQRVTTVESIDALSETLAAEQPEILIVDHDLESPGSGVSTCASVHALSPATRCIVVVGRGSSPDITAIARSGAVGVLRASVSIAEFVHACSEAAHGGTPVTSDIGALLMHAVGGEQVPGTTATLTAREAEVLSLAAEGLTNRDIADRLFLSENTVKNHMRRINEKLHVKSRTEAVMRAVREGTLLPGVPGP